MRATTVEADGSETTLGINGPGNLIGESALLEEGHRRARMRALRRSRLVVLDREWLFDLLSSQPATAMAVVRTVVERADQATTPSAAIVAIVPLDSTVVDEARLIGEAAAACSGQTLVQAADVANEDFGETADGFEWLDEMEQEHGGAILLGDPTSPEWTIAAAEAADRVVFVVDAEHGPEIGELEHQILRSIPREANATRLLLLVHPADTDRPSRTRAWLDRRELDCHLHLRRKAPADMHRVARYVIGRPLTMAIGAGGVRSAGAVGTVRALGQRGVAVDAVSGVSGGAIVASWISISTSIDELEDKTEWSMRKLLDFTLPVGAVIAGKRAWSRIQDAVGDRDIADTWLPLSIVTTDLTTGEPVNHPKGRWPTLSTQVSRSLACSHRSISMDTFTWTEQCSTRFLWTRPPISSRRARWLLSISPHRMADRRSRFRASCRARACCFDA